MGEGPCAGKVDMRSQ